MEKPANTTANNIPGIAPGRQGADEYALRFRDPHPLLNLTQALIEAERCYYRFDAPCTRACPAEINVPQFIQRIAQRNIRGAAQKPFWRQTCSAECVRAYARPKTFAKKTAFVKSIASKPVEIALLQRFVTDTYFSDTGTLCSPVPHQAAVASRLSWLWPGGAIRGTSPVAAWT